MTPRNFAFWRNAILIGAAHFALIAGLVRWSKQSKPADAHNVLWMGGAAESVAGSEGAIPHATPTTSPGAIAADDPDRDRVVTAVKSDIQLPTATPTPIPTPKSTPLPTPRVTPSRKPTPTPVITPKVTPKAPRKKPFAKATPKRAATPVERAETEKEEETPAPSPAQTPAVASGYATKHFAKSEAGTGRGESGKGTADFGWFASMLHDRFYSEWNQPTANVPEGAKMSAIVRLRIEKDGRVSKFEVVRSSGSSAVDESIAAVGKRVTEVDALPTGLGDGDHYEVNIKFELSSDK